VKHCFGTRLRHGVGIGPGKSQLNSRIGWRAAAALAMVAGWLALCGCGSVPVHKQRLVSKPNMLFSDSAVFTYLPKLLVQTEPGAAATGGSQAAGCTSCR